MEKRNPFSFRVPFLMREEEERNKKRKMTLSLLSFFLRKKSKRNRRGIFPPFLRSFFQIEMEEGKKVERIPDFFHPLFLK